MSAKDKRIDLYISKSKDFAKPILNHIRTLVHEVCPNVQETIKWGMPYFDYNGSILCGMASFKEHCAFGFRKYNLLLDPYKVFVQGYKHSMGQFGPIKNLSDLPSDSILKEYIIEAAMLNEVDNKSMAKSKIAKRDIDIPEFILKALKKNKEALKYFNSLSYTHKKEYVIWVTEAKKEETREKRISQMLVKLIQDRALKNKL